MICPNCKNNFKSPFGKIVCPKCGTEFDCKINPSGVIYIVSYSQVDEEKWDEWMLMFNPVALIKYSPPILTKKNI